MKELTRNLNNNVVGGVCSGISDYLGIDVSLTRIVFLFSMLYVPTLLLYLIMWIVIPGRKVLYEKK